MEKTDYKSLTYQTGVKPKKQKEYDEVIPLPKGTSVLEAVLMVGETINGKKIVGIVR